MTPEWESFQNKLQRLEIELKNLQQEFQNLKAKQQQSQPKQESTPKIPEISYQWLEPIRRNWELWIGGNWLARTGLVVLVITIVWFLDLAFREEWLTDSLKIYLGLLAGYTFIFVSFTLSRGQAKILTPPMVGSGFAIFYASIYSSYRFYGYFGIPETFFYLLIISLALVILSKIFSIQVVYGFGLIGVLFLPLLFPSGDSGYRFFFSYLAIQMGIFVWASWKQNWNWAGLLLFLSVWLLIGLWLKSDEASQVFWVPALFIFLTMVFFVSREIFLENPNGNLSYRWLPYLVILGSYLVGSISLNELIGKHYSNGKGLGFLATGVLSSFFSYRVSKIQESQRLVPLLFFGTVVLLFAGMIESLEESWLTIGIAFFTFAYSFSIQSRDLSSPYNRFSRIIAVILWIYVFLRLLVLESDSTPGESPLLNFRFLQYLVVTAALAVLYIASSKETQKNPLSNFYIFSSIVVLVFGSLLEVSYGITDENLKNQGYSLVLILYGLGFLGIGIYGRIQKIRIAGLTHLVILLVKFVLYDIWLLDLPFRIASGLFIGIILVGVGYYYEKIKTKLIL